MQFAETREADELNDRLFLYRGTDSTGVEDKCMDFVVLKEINKVRLLYGCVNYYYFLYNNIAKKTLQTWRMPLKISQISYVRKKKSLAQTIHERKIDNTIISACVARLYTFIC